jgi:dihydroorotase
VRLTGGRLHVTHVSAKQTVDQIRRAAESHVPLTADVTPHHLAFTDQELSSYDTNFKVSPPLRSDEHRDALRSALAEGLIDAVATDHAPHAPEEKEQEFDQAPNGTTGLETSLACVFTELVQPGVLTLTDAVRRLSVVPAHILRLGDQGGPLTPGRPANLVVFDPASEWTVGDRPFRSMARNSAFTGRRLRGRVRYTMLRGQPTVWEEEPVR